MRRTVLVSVCLAVLTFAVYGQVAGHKFLDFDDAGYVLENPRVTTGLTLGNFLDAFRLSNLHYWHPVTMLSHAADCSLWGLNPAGHHLTNVLLHAVNVVLLFLALLLLTGAFWSSAAVAALFAVHPLNVETVAWISERKNLLSAFFWMCGLLAYAWYAARASVKRYVPLFLCFALGLMAKPAIVSFPFVLLLLDFWPLGRLGKGPSAQEQAPEDGESPTAGQASRFWLLVAEKIPLFGLVLVSLVLSIISVERFYNVIGPVSPMLRVANAVVSCVKYLGLALWPSGLAVYYPYPSSVPPWQVLGAALILAVVSVLVILRARKQPFLAVGWLWFLGTILPVLGFVQGGLWPAMADRFMYLPGIGLFIMAAWGLPELVGARPQARRVLACVAAALVVVLACLAAIQTRYWKNDQTLFTRAAQVTRDNFVALNNLGNIELRQGNLDKAMAFYQKAIEAFPDNALSYRNIADMLARKGDNLEAARHFERAISLYPQDPVAHKKYAKVLVALERFKEAEDHLNMAIELNRYDPEAFNNMAYLKAQGGKINEAVACYSQALKLVPDYPLAHLNLGYVLLAMGNASESIVHFQKVLRVTPGNVKAIEGLAKANELEKINTLIAQASAILERGPAKPELLNGLGTLYEKKGDSARALECYKKAIEINPGYANALTNLGLGLMHAGRNDEAEPFMRRAVAAAPDSVAAHYNMACFLARKGQSAEAFQWLEKTFALGFKDKELLKNDPDLANIRKLPEFERFLDR